MYREKSLGIFLVLLFKNLLESKSENESKISLSFVGSEFIPHLAGQGDVRS